MKDLARGFAQFAAIIMLLITLAVSTAAVAQWTGGASDASARAATLASADGR
ncbi:MAG TPA: hypothetical protein VER32_15480 [Pyrinomonadaceae bacterium]|nr:hypothetical protein [Pyrinomonadaceae bacterium]